MPQIFEEVEIVRLTSSAISTPAPRMASFNAVMVEKRGSFIPISMRVTDCFDTPARSANSLGRDCCAADGNWTLNELDFNALATSLCVAPDGLEAGRVLGITQRAL